MLNLGGKIRVERLRQKFTLDQLAKKCGLSKSFLSQIETGVTNSSIVSLRKIALALATPLSSFFEEPSSAIEKSLSNGGPVVRKDECRVLKSKDSLITYQLFLSDPNHRMEFLYTRLEVGGVSAQAPLMHMGEEAALVIQGKGRFEVEEQVYELEEGDFIYILEGQPHKFTNTGKVPLLIVGAISPPGF
jgi:transcriptional regulator with XRE-family HTH domain